MTIAMPVRFLLLCAMLFMLTGCVRLTLAWADLTPDRPAARPDVLGAFAEDGAVRSIAKWQDTRVPALREAFQTHVYGVLPDNSEARIIERRLVAATILDGRARLEEFTVEVSSQFGDAAPGSATFTLLLATPLRRTGPAPTIVMETFCRNHHTIPHPEVSRPAARSECDGAGPMSAAMTFVFGRYIATPPLSEIFDRGYALATFYPGDVVPDEATRGRVALRHLSAGHDDDATRWGAVAAWAWSFSRAVDILETDERVDAERIIAFGHSRYGKAALVAAAFDPRIAGVIAHQSGTVGAALNRHKAGESIAVITRDYPHWFSRRYAAYAGEEQALPVDQHQLLALIAPRPVLLGNARRDVWSDPEGTFISALGADAAYEFLGSAGLQQEDLRKFDPEADLSFMIRPGTHGITEEDWAAFFEFLAAHFGT